MRMRPIVQLLFPCLLAGCVSESGTPEERLQATLDDLVASDARVPGAVLVVRSPDLEFRGVAGAVSLDDEAAPMQIDDPFRAASATKDRKSVV